MHRTAHISFTGVPVSKRVPKRVTPDASHPPLAVAEQSEPVAPFIAWVFEQAKLNASIYRPNSLNRRLNACLRRLRAITPDGAQKIIERQPELLNAAVEALLLGVSEFFRDRLVFDEIRNTILPELANTSGTLNICSVGCSEGHELYSMAILLDEAGLLDRSQLIGIDCRPEAIVKAQLGHFSKRDVEGVPHDLRQTYFESSESNWTVSGRLRQRMHWQVGDALSLDGVYEKHIILFRNVALYLTPNYAACAWNHLSGQLKAGGVLICGKADKPPAALPLTRIAACVYKKAVS